MIWIPNKKPGIILAVYTDDQGEDYYLVKSLSHIQTVTTTSGDDCGNQFLTGTKVVICEKYRLRG